MKTYLLTKIIFFTLNLNDFILKRSYIFLIDLPILHIIIYFIFLLIFDTLKFNFTSWLFENLILGNYWLSDSAIELSFDIIVIIIVHELEIIFSVLVHYCLILDTFEVIHLPQLFFQVHRWVLSYWFFSSVLWFYQLWHHYIRTSISLIRWKFYSWLIIFSDLIIYNSRLSSKFLVF